MTCATSPTPEIRSETVTSAAFCRHKDSSGEISSMQKPDEVMLGKSVQ